MRMHFLGIGHQQNSTSQTNLFGELVEFAPQQNPDLFGNSMPVQTSLIVREKENSTKQFTPECQVTEIINTPKAFAALVDTAIFTIKKEVPRDNPELIYIDLRKPDATSFNISDEEWKQIKTSKDNLAGWERILDKAFVALGHNIPQWVASHNCDGDKVYRDGKSTLLKFKISFEPYRKAINYAIFSPTEYNCQVLEKIIKPGKIVFDSWWSKIETSRLIENNRSAIQEFGNALKPGALSLVGLFTDGGQGLATGNNGRFVGYYSTSRFATQCISARIQKMWTAIQEEPKLKNKFTLLSQCNHYEDVKEVLGRLKEVEIWALFDSVKETYGLRIFGKGFIYRIVPDSMIFDVTHISEKQKTEGLKGKQTYVPYDKGDREGNRWYLETPYLIDWSEEAVSWLKNNSGHSGVGMPVVRNPQFYFRNGFCWSDILNPNSSYIKCRLKGQSVNDVKSMSLYDETGLGDKYIVTTINSFLMFKVLREFLNSTVAIQMNDIRKLPIKTPTAVELHNFNTKFDQCFAIKKQYFKEEIDRIEMTKKLFPIEQEIDLMVNKLYGVDAEIDNLPEEIEFESELDIVDDEE